MNNRYIFAILFRRLALEHSALEHSELKQTQVNELLDAVRESAIDGNQIFEISTAPEDDFQKRFEDFIQALDTRLQSRDPARHVHAGFVLKMRAMLENIRQESRNVPGQSRDIRPAEILQQNSRGEPRKRFPWTFEQVRFLKLS